MLWQKGGKMLVMAPMDDVTDIAFRQMFAKYSVKRRSFLAKFLPKSCDAKTFISFTEFVSADGLALADQKGKKKLLKKLEFKANEYPIVAQIFGSNIENLVSAAKLVESLGFDGVDINMGCPDKSVEKTGSGATLINNPELARKIVSSIKKEVQIPVSVKTRLGYNKIDLSWIEQILQAKPANLTVHLRTRKEMSKVPAHWEYAEQIVKLRDSISKDTTVIGNGDIQSVQEAYEKINKHKLDGAMIGRGIFGNPLFFLGKTPTSQEKIHLLIEHIKLFEKHLLNYKSYAVMKKHFKAYIEGFPGAVELRKKLMETTSCKEAIQILKEAQNF